jgi:hypothetical protein
MDHVARRSSLPLGQAGAELIAQRYQKLAVLGGGGMAYVYDVLDQTTGQRVALKRPTLQGSPEHQRRIHDLFTREFHALCQLAHPRIVKVYDYGVDRDGPYYTMEILDGGDLQQLVPLDYRRVCEVARDVCSALTLLHSRRIVHRDLGPRNVRCTSGGVAKLIDFGAMTQMGPSKEVVGTPAFCAPEVVEMHALDARTDLFALGATLYYALTEHHAYPARDFASLHNAWRFALTRPSELVSDVPEALDALILDLLQLDPNLRPSNAAEVIERLLAIEGRPANTQYSGAPVVAQSFLATPAFVGRSEELPRVRSRIVRGLRKHGAVVLITSHPGAGRSRFLEACLLEAKLQGYLCLRADADDAALGDYGTLRRLLSQLQQVLPELAQELITPELPTLGCIAPELLQGAEIPLHMYGHPDLLRSAVQEAARRVFLAAAERVPLLIALDDLHRCDEPSAAALALLSRHIERSRIVILASAQGSGLEKNAAIFAMLIANASSFELPNLSEAQSHELLGSIFGVSPELEPLARRLHALSQGSPRDLMRLAQHLVDRNLARYSAGSWSLPPQLDARDLPASVAQLMRERVAGLGPEAKQLAGALALCPDQSFGFDEALALSTRPQAAALTRDLDVLSQAEIVRLRGGRSMLADLAWVGPLLLSVSAQDVQGLHLRLAAVFEQRGDAAFRRAQHLLRGGQTSHALDIFTAHAIASRKQTDSDPEAFRTLLRSLPGDWFETYDEVLRRCDELDRPKRDRFAIRARLGGIVALSGTNDRIHVPAWLSELKFASGLVDYEAADPALDPLSRLKAAFEAATARHQQQSEHERTVDPKQAIALLAMAERFAMQASAPALDLPLLRLLPSLQPFVVVAPPLAIGEKLRLGVSARVGGRIDLALQTYKELLERVAAPDAGGLDPTHVVYTRLLLTNAVGFMEAGLGIQSCLARADALDDDPMFRVNASIVRMQHALWQGDSLGADRERKRVEERRIQGSYNLGDHSHLLWQVLAYSAMEDLTRLKQTLMEVIPLAEKYAGWRPVELYGKAEYQRIRGDYVSSLQLLGPALEDVQAGDSPVWPQLAAAQIRTLAGSGQLERALALGQQYAEDARNADMGDTAQNTIALALEVARAKHGDAGAGSAVDAIIEHVSALGATGLPLGLAYEARAYIALFQADKERYERYSTLAIEELTRHKNPALSARLQRLKREAQRRRLGPTPELMPRVGAANVGLTMLKSRLAKCSHSEERAHTMLLALAQRAGVTRGFLFHATSQGPTLSASLSDDVPDPLLCAMVQDYLYAETQGREQNTGDTGETRAERSILEPQWTAFGDAQYRHVLLSHYSDSGYCVTGVAVFVVMPGQPFTYPSETATHVSQLSHELGDATAILVEDDKDSTDPPES